jgi:alcohol dehydrogenase class IV
MKSSFYTQDKVSTFLSPNKISIGTGAAKQVGIESKALGGKKALIVTDPGVVKAGLIDGIQESLESEKLDMGVYDRVVAEPPARVIDESAQIAREEGYDIIIGIGGGSSLDAAKGASIMATNKGRVLDYAGVDMIPKGGLPKILLPTTGGTGSEATRVFVVTDEEENTKKVVYSNFNLADVAIIDPLLSISMPPAVTADTGIDALVHAIEAYVSVNATPFSDILAIEAIRLIAENLPIAYAKGSNIEARYNMALAANLAGLAFTSGGLGGVHGLAYVLGTEYHMSHGRSNAIMLPHVMDYNKIGNLEKYAQIARAMGEHIQGLCAYEAADKSIDAVKKLLEAVDISIRLPDYGIRKEDLPRLVQGGMKQARLFVPNPRDLTKEDVEKIYKMALI